MRWGRQGSGADAMVVIIVGLLILWDYSWRRPLRNKGEEGQEWRGTSDCRMTDTEAVAATGLCGSCSWDYKIKLKWRLLHMHTVGCSLLTYVLG